MHVRAPSDAPTEADDLTRTLVGFARVLRAAGVPATPDRLHQTVAAVGHLDVARRADVYWAGRLTLCAAPDDLDRYDRAFAAYFAGVSAPRLRTVPPVQVARPVAVPGTDRPAGGIADPEELPAATASEVEVLRHRDLAALERSRARGRPPADRAARPGRRDPAQPPAPAGRAAATSTAAARCGPCCAGAASRCVSPVAPAGCGHASWC